MLTELIGNWKQFSFLINKYINLVNIKLFPILSVGFKDTNQLCPRVEE